VSLPQDSVPVELPNGPGAAAILAAGIGSFALGMLAVLADHVAGFGRMMVFYRPTGPLSGVTACAVLVWLAVWAILDRSWRRRTVRARPLVTAAIVLLLLGLLLTFPPLGDLF
jgi:hypothetical protein